MCSYVPSFVYNSFPSHDELLICLQNIGLAQFENQNVSRPNHDFFTLLLILKNFSLGAGWNAKI